METVDLTPLILMSSADDMVLDEIVLDEVVLDEMVLDEIVLELLCDFERSNCQKGSHSNINHKTLDYSLRPIPSHGTETQMLLRVSVVDHFYLPS
jgi:hypothetical protein